MKIKSVSRTSALGAAAVLSVTLALASPDVQTGGVAEHVTAAQLKAYVARTEGGLAVHPLTKDPASQALVVRRDKSGEVELHTDMNDVMVVQKGTATMILGGVIEGGAQSAPNERRGGRIVGGRTYRLAPGDTLWIPAGVPHQMVLSPGASFRYLVVKSKATDAR